MDYILYVYSTEEEITKAMIQGNVDISFLTYEMLDNTKFAETNMTGHANGCLLYTSPSPRD